MLLEAVVPSGPAAVVAAAVVAVVVGHWGPAGYPHQQDCHA